MVRPQCLFDKKELLKLTIISYLKFPFVSFIHKSLDKGVFYSAENQLPSKIVARFLYKFDVSIFLALIVACR